MHQPSIETLPNDKILDWTKLKAFADDIKNMTEKLKFVVRRVEKHCGKGQNASLPAFFPIPSVFKQFLSQGQ